MINLYLSENNLSLCRIIQPCLRVCFRTSKCHSQRFLGVELRELLQNTIRATENRFQPNELPRGSTYSYQMKYCFESKLALSMGLTYSLKCTLILALGSSK